MVCVLTALFAYGKTARIRLMAIGVPGARLRPSNLLSRYLL